MYLDARKGVSAMLGAVLPSRPDKGRGWFEGGTLQGDQPAQALPRLQIANYALCFCQGSAQNVQ